MNKFFNPLSTFAVIALFITACGARVVEAQPEEQTAPKVVTYEAMFGKYVNAEDVADFIASNHCTPSGQFQLCKSVGLALWSNADQMIKIAYFYPSNADDFAAYKGELPFGLASDDSMASVEQKFGQPNLEHGPQVGWQPGLPSEDHDLRYWANYKGFTIVYNSSSQNDKSATIHAILVSK